MEENLEITDIESEKDPDFSFKLVMLGNSGVGKTSLVKYEIKNTFINNKDSTIIFEHSFKNFSIFEKIVRLQIWDTCGQETYYSSLKNFYRSALCVIVVFSLDDMDSFKLINRWIQDIKNNHNSEDYILILIGNKSDLDDLRVVSKEIIEEYCNCNGIENYFEASSKTGENVHEIFKTIVKKLFIKFAMPIIDDNNESQNEKKNVLYDSNNNKNCFNKDEDCCKSFFCNIQ